MRLIDADTVSKLFDAEFIALSQYATVFDVI